MQNASDILLTSTLATSWVAASWADTDAKAATVINAVVQDFIVYTLKQNDGYCSDLYVLYVDLVVEMNYERECDLVELWRLLPTSEEPGRNWYISTAL